MRYFSTNGSDNYVDLYEAVLKSFAPDGGVYMPLSVPVIPRALFNNIDAMSMTDIAYIVASTLFGSDIEPAILNNIVKETLTFDIPLIRLSERTYALELFHGPSHTFKDIGARFMARIIYHIGGSRLKKKGPLNILVATQGDTGYAVADAFGEMPGVKVFIFHPGDRKLRVPEHAPAKVASNVISVEVRGTLDDCQELVRRAYEDEELNRRFNLTSANSINIARLLPQTFFYFYAYARLRALGEHSDKIVIAMPCGNLGNLTAALFAKQMGLPVSRILAAGRGHERLWGEMQGGILSVNHFNQRALSTNLSRINCLMERNPELGSIVDCKTFSIDDISAQISLMYASCNYLMDRNTAMASRALMENKKPDETGVFLATAHPEMYANRLKEIIGIDFTPEKTNHRYMRDKNTPLSPTLPAIKHFLLENI